jgi:hypothetical protein
VKKEGSDRYHGGNKMGVGKTMGLALAGAAALAGAGAVEAGEPAGENPQVEVVKRDNLLFEETVTTQDGKEEFDHYLQIGDFAKMFFVDTETLDSLDWAARGKFDFGFMKGSGELFGYSDSDENMGVGINARGSIGDFRIGGALEKMVTAGIPERFGNIWVARDFGNLTTTAGIAKDDNDSYGIASFLFTKGRYDFGAGTTLNSDGEGFATAVFGRHYENRGEGLGYRVWMKHDLEHDYSVDLLLSTNTTISRGSMASRVSPDDGAHDGGIVENWFDWHAPLWVRTTPGGIIAHANYSDVGDVEKFKAECLKQFAYIGSVSPRAGIGYGRIDDGTDVTESVSGQFGVGFKNGNYVDLKVTGAEEQKPVFSITAGVNF